MLTFLRLSICLFIALFSQTTVATFKTEGSDLLMGVGPAHIAQAGAVSADVDGIYALFWNPAGLARSTTGQIAISRQLDASLETFNFIGISHSAKFTLLSDMRVAYAFAWLPRLHVATSGAFSNDSFENLFLRFALPAVPDDFNGDSRSKTRDFRFGLAVAPGAASRWSVGASIGVVRCVSHLCGSTLSAPELNYTAQTEAIAIAVNLGTQVQLTSDLKFALNVRDINTRLHVDTTVTQGDQIDTQVFDTNFPRDIVAGFSWQAHKTWKLSADYQSLSGLYGQYAINLQLLRMGVNYDSNPFTWRGGVLIPIILRTGLSQNLRQDLPAPLVPSAGLTWRIRSFIVDLALYPHPVMSYHYKRLSPSADASITLHF